MLIVTIILSILAGWQLYLDQKWGGGKMMCGEGGVFSCPAGMYCDIAPGVERGWCRMFLQLGL